MEGMRPLAILFLVALSLFVIGHSQNPKSPNDVPPPSIPDEIWSVDAGNGRISLRFEWRDDGIHDGNNGTHDGSIQHCEKYCDGKKHLLHSQCDDSCDRACFTIHKFDEPYRLYENTARERLPGWNQANQDFVKFGSGNYDAAAIAHVAADSAKKALEREKDKWTAHIDMRHWFQGSCGGITRTLKEHWYTGIVHYELYREVVLDDGKIMHTKGPSGSMQICAFSVMLDTYTDSKPYVWCRCTIVREDPEQHGYMPIPQDRQTGVCLATPIGDVPCTDKFLQDCGFAIECDSMNECTVSAENSGSDPFELCVYPGTIFQSQDPAIQDVATMAKCNLMVPAKELLASISRSVAKVDRVSAKVRVACINMSKKEPNSKTKFVVKYEPETVLAKIANLQSKQRISGPWDQARTWVYTDKASYDDIAKVLLPTPSKGFYARGLYQLATDCEVDLGAPAYDKCFEPSLLGSTPPSPSISRWLARELHKRNPSKLASWLRTSGNAFAELVAKGDRADVEHVQNTFQTLASAPGDPVWKALETMLISGIPQGAKAKFAELGAGTVLLPALRSEDAESAAKALDAFEAYGANGGMLYLLNPNPGLPQATRDRARKLAEAQSK